MVLLLSPLSVSFLDIYLGHLMHLSMGYLSLLQTFMGFTSFFSKISWDSYLLELIDSKLRVFVCCAAGDVGVPPCNTLGRILLRCL
jgi:hypothetical protein